MRRLPVIGAVALLVLATVPIASAAATSGTTTCGTMTSGTTTSVTTRHVDGSIVVTESNGTDAWIARFEVRTTPSGVVRFGYLELYGIGGIKVGQIVQMSVDRVEYFKDTTTGAPGARLYMREWEMVPPFAYHPSDVYDLTDGASVGQPDTFLHSIGWHVDSGNISIYTTSGQNSQ